MLTEKLIRNLEFNPAGKAIQITWDGHIPGFGVKVYPSGRKSFIISYRSSDKRAHIHTLGDTSRVPLTLARQSAQRLIAKPEQATLTVADLADVWMERYATKLKRSWEADLRRIDTRIKPVFGDTKITKLSISNVTEWHTTISKTAPVEANRCLTLLSTIINAAHKWQLYVGPNPCVAVRKNREISRERWLTKDEVERLKVALGQVANIYIRSGIELLLFTGCRKSEILTLTWKMVDLDQKHFKLTGTKNGRTRIVPLSDPAISILTRLPRVTGNEHVLPSGKDGHVINLRKTWVKLCKQADIPNATLHDLRRTVGSWLAQDGVSLPLIASVLGHSNTWVTSVYARLDITQARAALDNIGTMLAPGKEAQ